jgi:dTDP-glucose pyrophosphorylase
MKAVILAGGRGSRLGEHKGGVNKCMLPLFGKPLIEYSLENAVRVGIREIVVVVGYRAMSIINAIGTEYAGASVRYVLQDEPQGLVHAIDSTREVVAGEDFMLFLADEILWKPNHPAMIDAFRDQESFAVCGVVEQKDPAEIRKTYALIQDDRNRRIYRLIEKPRNPRDPVQGTGNCIFRAQIFDYVEHTPINQVRREKELPDLIQCAIDDGHLVQSFPIGGAYVNINEPADIEHAERANASWFATDDES